MTFPAGPPVSFTDLRAEFGGTVANDLGDYVRGGAFVPDVAQNAGVPTSPPISLGDFYGSVAEVLRLDDHDVFVVGASPQLARVDIRSNGETTPTFSALEWANTQPNTNGGDYEIRATNTAGEAPNVPLSDALDTWLSLSVDRGWQTNSATATTRVVELLLEFRLAGGATLTSGTITLSATGL